MACSDTKKLLEAIDRSAPCIVDMSPSVSDKPGRISLDGKNASLISGPSKKEGKKKRMKSSHCCNGSGVSCMTVILVLLLIGQFLWTLSLQISVLRVLDKAEAIEKISDVTLDFTTKVAASAAEAATQAATAANKAIDAVISMGLAGFKNSTDGEMLLSAALTAKKQTESAALAALEHANAAALAKDRALASVLEVKQSIVGGQDFRKSLVNVATLMHFRLSKFIPEDQESSLVNEMEVDALPLESGCC